MEKPILPENLWPDSDKRLLAHNGDGFDLFDDDEEADGKWSKATRKNVVRSYRRWLGWCANNQPHSLDYKPGDRVTKPAVLTYLKNLQSSRLAPKTIGIYVYDLYSAMTVLAPDDNWHWLLRGALDIGRRARRSKMIPIVDSRELYQLALRRATYTQNEGPTYKNSIECRDMLIIALLAARPLRASNLVSLHVGYDLFLENQHYRIALNPTDVKNETAINFRIPKDLGTALDCFYKALRPLIPESQGHSYIFASSRGGHITPEHLCKLIKKRTKTLCGVSINPHAFRHSAATMLAERTPKQIRTASVLLGHHNPNTVQEYYNLARSSEAQTLVSKTILNLRN